MDTLLIDISEEIFNFSSFNNELSARGISFNLSPTEILRFITNNHYSVRHFTRNWRKNDNALKTKIIVLDIDEPQLNHPNIDSVKDKLKSYNHILSTTRNHNTDKNGIVCDRYRIIIFCSEYIEEGELYKKQILDVSKYLGLQCDERCVDLGRFFYKSQEIISYNFHGKSFKPVTLEEIEVIPLQEKNVVLWEADIELTEEMKIWIDKKILGKRVILTRERLIRILIAQKGLLIRFDISKEWLSDYLHIKRDTLSVWLKDIMKRGWLSIANEAYGKGYKAISYRAENGLAELIMNYYGFKDRKDSYSSKPLPMQIKDGEWHRTVYIASFRFQNDETDENFIGWFKSVPGWDKKTRLKEAYDAFKCMKRYLRGLDKL